MRSLTFESAQHVAESAQQAAESARHSARRTVARAAIGAFAAAMLMLGGSGIAAAETDPMSAADSSGVVLVQSSPTDLPGDEPGHTHLDGGCGWD